MVHANTPACKRGILFVAGVRSIWRAVAPVAGLCPNAAGGGLALRVKGTQDVCLFYETSQRLGFGN